MSFDIRWNHSPGQILGRIFDEATMTFVHTRIKAYCSDYVPATTAEALTDSAIPTPEYLLYPGPYAHFQWEGKVFVDERGSTYAKQNHSKHPTNKDLEYSPDVHPLATSHWEAAAMAAHKGDLCENITNYLKGK